MNNQQIALSLVASLDRGNIESEVSQLASSMASSIEAAFASLGDKIAQSIIKGGTAGMQGLGQIVQNHTLPSSTLPSTTSSNIGSDTKDLQSLKEQIQALKEQIAKTSQVASGGGQDVGSPLINPQRPGSANQFTYGSTVDMAVQQARAISATRGAGMEVEMSPEQKELSQGALKLINENLEKNLSELAANVGKLSGSVDEQAQAQNNIHNLTQRSEALKSAKGIIAGAEPDAESGMDMGKIAGIVGAVGTVTRLIGTAQGSLRGGEAASAEYSNLTARQFMRGNIEETIATQRIGGQDAATGRAEREEGMKTAGEIGVAIAAAIAAPMTGGGSLLLGGAALGLGAKGAMDAMNFRQNVQGNINAQIGAEMGQSAEFMQMSGAGRSQSVQAFQTARGLGAPELSNFLEGGQSLTYGAERGLGANDVNSTLATLGRAGGNYRGKSLLEGMGQGSVNDILNLQSQGVGSAADMATGLMRNSGNQTAEGFREAVEKTKDMWTDIISSGMDKTSGIKMMADAAQTIAQGGFGTGSQQISSVERASSVASAMGITGGGAMDFVKSGLDTIQNKTKGGSGIMATAGFEAARGTKAEIKKRLGLNVDEMTLQKFGADEEGLEALFHQQKPHAIMSEKDKQAMREITRNDQSRRGKAAAGVANRYGSGSGDYIVEAEMAGATNLAQAAVAKDLVKQGKSLQTMPGDRLPGQPGYDPKTAGAGGATQQALAQKDAALITTGLSTLGTNLQTINGAFTALLARIQVVMKEEATRSGTIFNAPKPGTHAMGSPDTMRKR